MRPNGRCGVAIVCGGGKEWMVRERRKQKGSRLKSQNSECVVVVTASAEWKWVAREFLVEKSCVVEWRQ